MSTLAPSTAAPDSVCAAAIDLARAAALEEADDPALVGDHLGVDAEEERVVLHRFACTAKGYVGWHWAVEVSRASRSKTATVNDVVLLPGEGAVLAPPWVPWAERVRPGDLGVGDLLPTPAGDERLVLSGQDVDELSDPAIWHELGLGRARVLSPFGREEAAERWYAGEPGPDAAIAKSAPASCRTCGFYVRLVGALGRAFGACANEWAPDDGRVVSDEHGCGAHSEVVVPVTSQWEAPRPEHEYDIQLHDALTVTEAAPAPAEDAHAVASVTDAEPAEPYGHS